MQLVPSFSEDYSYFITNWKLVLPVVAAAYWKFDENFEDLFSSLKYAIEVLFKLIGCYLLAFYWDQFWSYDYIKPYRLTQQSVLSSTVLLFTFMCTWPAGPLLIFANRINLIKGLLIGVYISIHFNFFNTATKIALEHSNVTELNKDEQALCYSLLAWILICYIARRIKHLRCRKAYIFISYRRKDSDDVTKNIYYNLVRAFGKNRVFRDKASIPLGMRFDTKIRRELSSASVVLAVIGPSWLIPTENGQSRLDEPDDPVRIELKLALEYSIPIIPLLVKGAKMPELVNLPEELRNIAKYNGQVVRDDDHFEIDMARLVEGIINISTYVK